MIGCGFEAGFVEEGDGVLFGGDVAGKAGLLGLEAGEVWVVVLVDGGGWGVGVLEEEVGVELVEAAGEFEVEGWNCGDELELVEPFGGREIEVGLDGIEVKEEGGEGDFRDQFGGEGMQGGEEGCVGFSGADSGEFFRADFPDGVIEGEEGLGFGGEGDGLCVEGAVFELDESVGFDGEGAVRGEDVGVIVDGGEEIFQKGGVEVNLEGFF